MALSDDVLAIMNMYISRMLCEKADTVNTYENYDRIKANKWGLLILVSNIFGNSIRDVLELSVAALSSHLSQL